MNIYSVCSSKLWDAKSDEMMLKIMTAALLRASCVPDPGLGAMNTAVIITVKMNFAMYLSLVKDEPQCVKCYNGNC